MNDPDATAADAKASAGRAILLLSLAAFASAATTRICDALLPQLASEFAVTPGRAAAVVTAYSVTYGLMQPPLGVYGDRFGKYPLILACCLASLATTAACALASTLDGLALARLAAGAAAAGIVPLSIAWIGDAVAYEERQTTIARYMMGQITGLVSGQAFGGWFGEQFGWRSTFVVIFGIYIVATLGLGRELMVNPLTRNAAPPDAPRRSFVATMRAALRNPRGRRVLAACFLEGFFCFGATAYITTMLHRRFDLSFGQAGFVLAAFGAGGLLYAVLARKLVPRFGETGVSRISAILFVIAFGALALAPVAWIAAPACVCGGAAFYLLHSVLQVNATQISPEARGAGMALFATSFFIGQGAGVAAAGPIVDAFGAGPIFLIAAVAMPALALFVSSGVATSAGRGRYPTS